MNVAKKERACRACVLNNASYKGNVTFEMSLKNVTVTYPEGRLEEIKEKSEQQ